ncbi:MAG: penicillin-binding transpeptidase domain-containing protein [Clostridiales bacterium]
MKLLKDKFNVIYLGLFIISGIMVIQLVNLQIINGARYEEESQQKLLRNRRIIAPRGNIYDRNGTPIAINRLSYTVEITKTMQNNDELNSMLLELVKIFEDNNDNYEKSLSNYLTNDPVDYGSYLKNSSYAEKNWKKDIAGDNKTLIKKLKNPNAIFKYLREEKFEIDKKYSDIDAYRIMTLRYEILIRGYSILNSLTIAKDVGKVTVAKIEELNHLFPGVSTNIEPMRKYINIEPIAHVIGYVANIDNEEYNQYRKKGYYMTDYIGKMGIEKSYENHLRGEDGQLSLESDIWNRKSNQLKEEKAKPGDDITLTIDMKLQSAAMKSLKANIEEIRNTGKGNNNYRDTYFGSVVAIDVNTGEILVMASYPSFDPTIFITSFKNKKSQKAIEALYDPSDTSTSQYNRAILGIYPPGSTYKPLVGIAALEEGKITKDTIIEDPGFFYEEGVKLTCLEWRMGMGAHNSITLKDGLKTSCNVFFYKLGIKLGIDKIDQWSKMFGLGEYVGVEIEGESKGVRSNPKYHDSIYDYKFGKVLTAYSSIGQGYNLFTPLQLANYVSTISNGGKKYQPHLVKGISDNIGTTIQENKIEYKDLNIDKKNIQSVLDGMVAVTSEDEGTAVGAFEGFPYKVAAKTGTAQKGETNHSDYGLFIAAAPADNPKIAVCVVIERGVFGTFAAPVARDIFDVYFKTKNDKTNIENLKENEFEWIQ